MTPDDLASLTLEHLRAIRADMADLKDRMTALEVQLSAVGQQLAGLTRPDNLLSDLARKTPPL